MENAPKINGRELPAGFVLDNKAGKLREITKERAETVFDTAGHRVGADCVGDIVEGSGSRIPSAVQAEYRNVADAAGLPGGMLRDKAQIEAVVGTVLGQNSSMSAKQLLDSAPTLYAYGDLIYRMPEVLREVLTAPYARTVFPVLALSTWMQTWEQPAIRERSGYAQIGNLSRTTRTPTLQHESAGRRVGSIEYMKSGADWDWLELAKAAEARDRGARINYDFVSSRLMSARREILRTENLIVMFGLDGTNIKGLLSDDNVGGTNGILTNNSAQTFVDATPDQARDMLLTGAIAIIENGEREASIDSIALGTNAWVQVNKKIYTDAASNTGRTVLEMAVESLAKFGVRNIVWLPELDHKPARIAQLQQHGFSLANAQAYAGGRNQQNVMLTFSSDIEAGRIIEGRAIAARPPETAHGVTEVMMYASTGGFDLPQPKRYHLLQNV